MQMCQLSLASTSDNNTNVRTFIMLIYATALTPGLKFNPLFYSSLSISVSFKIIETKITIDAGKICKKYLQAYKQIAVKFLLNFTLTQG